MRVYIPATLAMLTELVADGFLQPRAGTAFAVTPTLREAYADDLMWLAAGADGLARLVDDPDNTRAGPNPPMTEMTRGRCDDHQEGRLAQAG